MKILSILLTFICLTATQAFEFQTVPDLTVAAGLRLPKFKDDKDKDDKSNEVTAYLATKVFFIGKDGVDAGGSSFGKLQIFGIGFAIQEAGHFNLVLSPVQVRTLNGVSFGLDIMPTGEDKRGGNIGVSVGMSF